MGKTETEKVKQYRPIVKFLVDRYCFFHKDRDRNNVESFAYEGLLNGIRTFDPLKNTQEKTWVWHNISYYIYKEDSKKTYNTLPYYEPLDETLHIAEESVPYFNDKYEHKYQKLIKVIKKTIKLEGIRNPLKYDIFFQALGLGDQPKLTPRELSEKYKLTEPTIRKFLKLFTAEIKEVHGEYTCDIVKKLLINFNSRKRDPKKPVKTVY